MGKYSITLGSVFLFILLLFPAPSFAAGANYFSVVIQTTPSKSEAIETAKKASSQLVYHLAEETLKKPPASLLIKGLVVSLHQEKNKEYRVTTYLGNSKAEADLALAQAKKFFPQATLEKVAVDENKLDLGYQQTLLKRVIILGSEKEYGPALAKAKEISKKSGLPFSTRQMIYDPKRGLIWPDNFEDEIYRGSYFGRRSNDDCNSEASECITIERSDFYGFTKGLYIVVGGIYEAEDEKTNKKVNDFKKIVPDSYAKATAIYMGCVH